MRLLMHVLRGGPEPRNQLRRSEPRCKVTVARGASMTCMIYDQPRRCLGMFSGPMAGAVKARQASAGTALERNPDCWWAAMWLPSVLTCRRTT